MNPGEAFDMIKKGYEADRLAHAYVISAPDRNSCVLMADDLLQLFFCEGDAQPCLQCSGCKKAADHLHADLEWVAPEMKSRVIAIDRIRAAESRLYMTSYVGGWKICVIESADRMKEQAANALLKTLEEPPAKTVFFLLTDNPQSLLPTIISRCQRISISGLETEGADDWSDEIYEILEQVGTCKPISDFALADRMMVILKELKAAVEKEEKERWKDDAEENSKVLDARIGARYRGERTRVIGVLMTWFRDLYLLASGAGEDVVCNLDRIDILKGQLKSLDYSAAKNNLTVIEDVNRQLESNVTERAVINLCFGKLR
ncbi:hypothetical protein BVX97_04890 [bacterium E08(2017)]|nr:hypothetical protein BVX97_04890 [bacterium E08(2017)]